MRITKDASGQVLKLAGTLGIGVAEELQTALRDYIGEAARPIVDLSGVEECDTTALQLLCSAGKTAERAGKRLETTGISAAAVSASAALGISIFAPSPGASGSVDAG